MPGKPQLRRVCAVAFCCLSAVSAGFIVSATAWSASDDEVIERGRSHWSFQPIVRADVPTVKNQSQVANPVDAFLLARLEEEGLKFSPAAGKRELLRRAKFDLLGLPPTPEELAAFLADEAPDAYERLIDGFLASPHYGETWGRHWLDIVRYAETAGYNADPARPNAYKYRDYVIRSFNEDKPYDQFVREQIAGDELFPDNREALIGSGYLLLWPDESNASNILLARQDALNDLTGNVGNVFLGLSIGCAQCHNHKFDPILQKDFYRLQAFFSGIVRRDNAPVGTNEQLAEYRAAMKAWLAETADVRAELHRIEMAAAVKAGKEKRMKFPDVVLNAIDTMPEQRDSLQQQLCFWSERQIDIKEKDLVKQMSEEDAKRREELTAQLAEMEKRKPKPVYELAAIVAGEVQAVPPKTNLLAGGSYDKPLEEVTPGYLTSLAASARRDAEYAPPHDQTSGRRSALADWLTDPQNPLVARVIVNRVWQGHFGRGLVDNGNDFGTQTPPPSHPELLDWLAAEFVNPTVGVGSGSTGGAWSIKRLHRLIMLSYAYRQAGFRQSPNAEPAAAVQADPGNRLYWHYPRRRIGGEAIRDSLLAVSGLLNSSVYGPSVWPELPADYSKREAWKVSEKAADRNRRSVYIHAKRNLPYPLLEAFDLPDMHESCARRPETTVAPQALMLLNGELVLEFARALAGRMVRDNPSIETDALVRRTYLVTLSREPTEAELDASRRFLEHQQGVISERLAAGENVLLPQDHPKFLDAAQAAAIVDFCHALLNANEFIYVD
jgi:hypothetical protein